MATVRLAPVLIAAVLLATVARARGRGQARLCAQCEHCRLYALQSGEQCDGGFSVGSATTTAATPKECEDTDTEHGIGNYAITAALKNAEPRTLALVAAPAHPLTYGSKLLSPVPAAMQPIGPRPHMLQLDGHTVMLFGGKEYDGDNAVAMAIAYDMAAEQWRRLADMPTGLDAFSAVNTGGFVVAVGGATGAGGAAGPALDTLYVYDIAADQWQVSPVRLSQARLFSHAVLVNGQIYVFSGWTGPPLAEGARDLPPCEATEAIALDGDGRPVSVQTLPKATTAPGDPDYPDPYADVDCTDGQYGLYSHYVAIENAGPAGTVLRCTIDSIGGHHSTCRRYSVADNQWAGNMCPHPHSTGYVNGMGIPCHSLGLISDTTHGGVYTAVLMNTLYGSYIPVNATGDCWVASSSNRGSSHYTYIQGKSAVYAEMRRDADGNEQWDEYACDYSDGYSDGYSDQYRTVYMPLPAEAKPEPEPKPKPEPKLKQKPKNKQKPKPKPNRKPKSKSKA